MKVFMKKLVALMSALMMVLSTASMQCVFAKAKKNVVIKMTMYVKKKKTVTVRNVKKIKVSPKSKVSVSKLKKKGKKVRNKYVILAKKTGKATVAFFAKKRYTYKITIKTKKPVQMPNKQNSKESDHSSTTNNSTSQKTDSDEETNQSSSMTDEDQNTTQNQNQSSKSNDQTGKNDDQSGKSDDQTGKSDNQSSQDNDPSKSPTTDNVKETLKKNYQTYIDGYQKTIDTATKYLKQNQDEKAKNEEQLKKYQDQDDEVVAKIAKVDEEIQAQEDDLKKAQALYDQSKPLLEKGSIYFFEKMGAKNAVNYFSTPIGVFKDLHLSDYNHSTYEARFDVLAGKYEVENMLDYTHMGADGDATSIINMSKAINLLKEQNTLRANEGKQPYKVSLLALANAEAESNYAYVVGGHPVFYTETQFEGYGYKPIYEGAIEGGGENFAWGYSDPFDGWYIQEKKNVELYDKKDRGETLTEEEKNFLAADGETGHYYNVVSSRFDLSAIGYKSKGGISIKKGRVPRPYL